MSNYLQRVLSSGARTTSPAKPPASARPLIPPVAPPVWTPLGEGGLPVFEGTGLETQVERAGASAEHYASSAAARDRQTQEPESSPNKETKQPPIHVSADAADADSAQTEHSPESVSHRVEPAPSTESASALPVATVIRAPKGLRGPAPGYERQAAMACAIEQTLATLAPRVTAASTESATAMPNAQEINSPSRAEPAIQVQRKPRAGRSAPVVSPAAARTPLGESTVAQAEIQTIRETADAERPLVSTPQADSRIPRGIIERLTPQQGRDMEPIAARPLFEREKGEADFFELRAKPPQPAGRAALPAPSDNRRRSQISIGRVDVQVNNIPAAAEPAPRPTRTPGYSNFLEARYLNRFSLKP